jgi:hypothetical protein
VAQEPVGSSPHSQEPATGPYPGLAESSPHPQASLPKIHSDPILPPTPWSSEWSVSFELSHKLLLLLFWNSVTTTDANKVERIQQKFAALCYYRFLPQVITLIPTLLST